MRSFTNPEEAKEYKLEQIRAAARVDFAMDDDNSRQRDRDLIRKQFQYSLLAGIVCAFIGFWLGYFCKLLS